jgi:hypothetical protein
LPERTVDMNSPTSSDWYVQVADREIGPLTAEQLAGLARDGQLLATDRVRSGGSGEWVTATNVKGLVFASQREEVREGASVASITAAPAKSDIPWYVKIRGEVIGPLSEAELARLAESGAINAHSPTRQGPEGAWTSAGQIRWLSLRRPSSSPPIAQPASLKSAPSQADQQATRIETLGTKTTTRSASDTQRDIVEFVIKHADELNVPGVKNFVEEHGRLSKELAEAKERQKLLAKAKQEYEPLEQRADKCRRALKDAETELTKLHRPLGEAAFKAFLAGEIDELPIFADRLAIHERVQELQQQCDGLSPGSDAGFVQQAKATAQQLAIKGKIKLEELKFGGLHSKIGREIVEGELDESIRCDTTAQLLSQIRFQRDGIARCSADLKEATTALTGAGERFSATVGLASIESSRDLAAAIKLCDRDIRKHECDFETATRELVDALQEVDASALPNSPVALLGRLADAREQDFAGRTEEYRQKGIVAAASAKEYWSGLDNLTKIVLSTAAISTVVVGFSVAVLGGIAVVGGFFADSHPSEPKMDLTATSDQRSHQVALPPSSPPQVSNETNTQGGEQFVRALQLQSQRRAYEEQQRRAQEFTDALAEMRRHQDPWQNPSATVRQVPQSPTVWQQRCMACGSPVANKYSNYCSRHDPESSWKPQPLLWDPIWGPVTEGDSRLQNNSWGP